MLPVRVNVAPIAYRCGLNHHALLLDHLSKRYTATDTTAANATTKMGEQWRPIEPLIRRPHQLPRLLASLSKLKLSALVVLTTAAGFQLSPLYSDMRLLGWTAFGVGLSSFAANTFNQWIEAPFDSQMSRTRTRPLPSHQLTPFGAFHFGLTAAFTGVGLLAYQVGWLPAILSAGNIILYAAIYTPLKRISIVNTWIGAVVGAIPPMIGYVGGGGSFDVSCLALGAILYCWQFPHFNSLSWNLKGDYSRAGYCMASVLNPRLNLNSAFRHAIATIPLSFLLIYGGICNEYFAISSTALNSLLVYYAYKFKTAPDRKSARRLFFYSLIHLPTLLLLMIAHRHHCTNNVKGTTTLQTKGVE